MNELNQYHLVEMITKWVEFQETDNQKRTTPVGKPFLFNDQKGAPIKKEFNFRAAFRISNCLGALTRPVMCMDMH